MKARANKWFEMTGDLRLPGINDLNFLPSYVTNAADSVYGIPSAGQPRLFEISPNLDGFLLHSKASLTDYLPSAFENAGILISPKMKSLMENFKLPPHNWYAATVYSKVSTSGNPFWFFNYTDSYLGYIDFPKSVFFNRGSEPRQYMSVQSEADFRERNYIWGPKGDIHFDPYPEKLVLALPSDGLDFFSTNQMIHGLYVSDRLKNAVKAAGLTGMVFKPATFIE